MENGEYRLIFTSSEISSKIRNSLVQRNFENSLLSILVKLTPCRSGAQFRKVYDRLSHLGAHLPPQVALFACSATLPDMFNNVLDWLGFHPELPYAYQISNICTNEMEHDSS
jgi:hypothetical protein